MPVLPEYRPTQAPGANAQNFLNAYEQTSSLMERKQRLAMAQEQQAMERAKFQAFLPAIQAKAQADMVSAAASIANTARMEQLRGQAAASSADYNDRFLNIMSIPDLNDRADTLAAFQGEIGWLDNEALPEYKGFVDAVDNAQAKTFTKAITLAQIEKALQVNANTGEVRKYVADAGTERANIRASSQERIKAIDADTKLTVEDKRAQRQAIGLETLNAKAAEADQLAADESAAGNEQAAQAHREVAARYRDALTKTTTFAGQAPSAARTKEQDVAPTPKSTAEPLPVLTLNGKKLGRMYVIDETTQKPVFAPDVKTPTEILSAVQQMVDDKVITPEEARATLTRLNFKKKQ